MDLRHDLRQGFRVLRARPVVTAVAIGVLALGMGSTIAVFSVVDAVLLRNPPYRESDRIATVWQTSRDRPAEREGVSPGAFLQWRERSTAFSAIAAAEPFSFDYLGGAEPQTLIGALVTDGFFEALGVEPMLGRRFLADEFVAGRSDVAILSYGGWQRLFGGAEGIVGRTLVLEGRPFLVVGVLPRSFQPRLLEPSREREVWSPKIFQDFERRSFRSRFWNAVARLAPGVSADQAQAELVTISERIAAENPQTMTGMVATLVPFRDHLSGTTRDPLLLLFAAIVLVLLIACANVASLLLARASERRREFAVRMALGAGRGRLVRQLLIESLTLASLACLLGLVVARWAMNVAIAAGPGGLPQLDLLAIDGRVLMFSMAATVLTALVFGLAPAVQSSRPALQHALRDAAGASAGPGRVRFGSALIVAEVALAFILLSSAGLLVRSFITLAGVDPGFSRSNVIALQVFAYGDRYRTPAQVSAFFDEALGRMRVQTGVETAGVVTAMPFLEANIGIQGGFRVEGRPEPPPSEQYVTFLSAATDGYFEAMRIPLRRGRLFGDGDRPGAAAVALVNDVIAERHWPGANPVGERIRVNWQGRWITAEVAGVVGGLRHDGLERPARPEVFLPFHQIPNGSMTFVARTTGDPALLAATLKSQVWALDPTMPFYDVATVDALVAHSLAPRRFILTLLVGFAAVAFVLAAAGIYGVLSFATLQRTREIGVRIAVGARAPDITRLVLASGMTRAAAGLALGLAVSAGVTRILRGFLYGVTPLDPLTLASVAALIVGVALAACYLPARRATLVDPLVALKAE